MSGARPPLTYPVKVASATPTGRFGAPEVLATNGILGAVALGPDTTDAR